jgi:prolyl 4-hydroxylase
VIHDELLAKELFRRIFPFLTSSKEIEAHGCNPHLRFLEYNAGQRFAPHVDGENTMDEDKTVSKLTVQVYLNDDYKGGETSFIEENIPRASENRERKVVPIKGETGMVLIFTQDLLHQGNEVIEGTKYTIRTDIMYPRNEKSQ